VDVSCMGFRSTTGLAGVIQSTTIIENMAAFDFNMGYSGGYRWLAATGEAVVAWSRYLLPALPSHNDNQRGACCLWGIEHSLGGCLARVHIQWLLWCGY